jgi:hypothetical protein
MIIRIPRFMVRAWDQFGDWSNVVIWESATKRFYLSRIDLFIAGGFVFCVGYYWLVAGWMGALQGAAAYIFVSMCALWFFRSE